MKYPVEKLLTDTARLTLPIVYQNFFENSFLNENLVKEAMNSAIKHKAKENFKIWIKNHECFQTQNKIINRSIDTHESIEQWTQEIFKEKFCILFSRAEQFNDDLAKKLGFFLQPIYEQRGITLGGASITIFLGNYGFTPSGVHQDQDENCIFHFHLGPHSKELLTWHPDQFIELTGSKEPYFEPEKLLPYATTHRLNPGDFLSLPPKHYHIGRTEQFSIDIVVVLSDRTNISLTQDIFNNLISEGFARNTQFYKLDPFHINDSSQQIADNMIDHLCINHKMRSESFEEVIKGRIENQFLTLKSNLNWSYPPLLKPFSSIDLKDKSIQIANPFKIYYQLNKNNKMSVFLRGREIIANQYTYITKVIDQLNLSEKLKILDLTQEFASNDSEYEIIISFLSQALEHRAIDLF